MRPFAQTSLDFLEINKKELCKHQVMLSMIVVLEILLGTYILGVQVLFYLPDFIS